MVMPLIARAVGHAPRRAYHVSHPLPVPWSCTLLPAHFVARTLCCPRPSSPAPFVACTLCRLHPLLPAPFIACTLHRLHPLSPTPFIAHAVCHTTHHPCRVSRPLPVPWSCTSSHAPC